MKRLLLVVLVPFPFVMTSVAIAADTADYDVQYDLKGKALPTHIIVFKSSVRSASIAGSMAAQYPHGHHPFGCRQQPEP
jgi:hypothetical protein